MPGHYRQVEAEKRNAEAELRNLARERKGALKLYRQTFYRPLRGIPLDAIVPEDLGTSDSALVNVRSADQHSEISFQSPLLCLENTHRYLPRSSRRLPE